MSTLEFNRTWLRAKFEEILERTVKAIEQLNDDQLNWRPNGSSHSIATLIKHIEGNALERIAKGILNQEIQRDREEELLHPCIGKEELLERITRCLETTIEIVIDLPSEKFSETQQVRKRERTNLDMLHQCAAHYSEHMGQILYIAKLQLAELYKSTSL